MSMQLRIVCPEECMYEGEAAYLTIPTTVGELGVLPHHASEICTIGFGRLRVSEERMGVTDRVFAVAEGYVQIANDEIIVLAERALDMAKVDADEVSRQLADFEDQLGKMSGNDARRAYLYNEIAWCRLLLD